ncbi:phosphodiesterase [Pseudothermotoga thermarum]|uniref:Phosphoesterase n=1 Tax=Pseudothermotoga thermarum DSM 5069 TaxID=688269 RepID=F7YYA9_9THEM|nr:phosphodiesterase [Pseudothermotoga thermarum]AEH50930.1 phosphodiesterase, MJ0936 family [Pseudothermotoga thermarum DSM 5069]
MLGGELAIRILVVSDTHGDFESWKKLREQSGVVDQIVHLGDFLYHGPRNPIPTGYDPLALAEALKSENLMAVRGNCDADVDLMLLGIEDMAKFMILTFGKYKMVCLHGENIKSDEDLIQLLKNYEACIVAFGHTHIPRLEKKEAGVILNPGSPSLPKKNNPPSFALIDFDNEYLKISLFTLSGKLVAEVNL